jgi:hypothetical protein
LPVALAVPGPSQSRSHKLPAHRPGPQDGRCLWELLLQLPSRLPVCTLGASCTFTMHEEGFTRGHFHCKHPDCMKYPAWVGADRAGEGSHGRGVVDKKMVGNILEFFPPTLPSLDRRQLSTPQHLAPKWDSDTSSYMVSFPGVVECQWGGGGGGSRLEVVSDKHASASGRRPGLDSDLRDLACL